MCPGGIKTQEARAVRAEAGGSAESEKKLKNFFASFTVPLRFALYDMTIRSSKERQMLNYGKHTGADHRYEAV